MVVYSKPNPLPKPEVLGAAFVQVLWQWIQDPVYWDGDYAHCRTAKQAWAKMARTNARLRREGSSCCASHDWCDANMAMDQAFRSFGLNPLPRGDKAKQRMADLWNAAWEAAEPALASTTPPTVR